MDTRRYFRRTVLFAVVLWAVFGAGTCYGIYRHGHASCEWNQFAMAVGFFLLIPTTVVLKGINDEFWPGAYWLMFILVAVIVGSMASEHDSTLEGIIISIPIFFSGFLPLRIERYMRDKRKERKEMSRKRKKH